VERTAGFHHWLLLLLTHCHTVLRVQERLASLHTGESSLWAEVRNDIIFLSSITRDGWTHPRACHFYKVRRR
jgi:hypothetical protein